MAVGYLDLRLCMVVLINMVKSPQFQIGGGGGGEVSWELITWFKVFSYVLVLSAFSFISIEVPLTLTLFHSTSSFQFRLRFGNRPVSAAVSFMASLILPQPVFLWYVYPVILLLSFYPTARHIDHALRWLHTVIPINQVYNISITSTTAAAAAAVVQVLNEQDQPSSETQYLEEAQQV